MFESIVPNLLWVPKGESPAIFVFECCWDCYCVETPRSNTVEIKYRLTTMAILPPSKGGTPTSASSKSPPRVQTARSRTKKLSDFDAYAHPSQVSYNSNSPPRSTVSNSPQSRNSPVSPRSTEGKRLSESEVYNLSSQVVYSPIGNSLKDSPARSDTMSDYNTVVSHKTSSTASTRSRRPGQAKVRLQQQQIGLLNHSQQSVPSSGSRSASSRSSSRSQQRGWHETMKQAASAANRKWEPKHGFEHSNGTQASSVAGTQSLSLTGASITPPREHNQQQYQRYQAPLMIDIEGENERMNVYDHFFDDTSGFTGWTKVEACRTQCYSVYVVIARIAPRIAGTECLIPALHLTHDQQHSLVGTIMVPPSYCIGLKRAFPQSHYPSIVIVTELWRWCCVVVHSRNQTKYSALYTNRIC